MQVQCLWVSLGKIKPVIMCHLSKDHHSLVPDVRVRNQHTIFKARVEGGSPRSTQKSCIVTARCGIIKEARCRKSEVVWIQAMTGIDLASTIYKMCEVGQIT